MNLTFSVLSFPRLKLTCLRGTGSLQTQKREPHGRPPSLQKLPPLKPWTLAPAQPQRSSDPHLPIRFPEDERKLSGPLQLESSNLACCTHHNGLPDSHLLTAGQRAHCPAGSQLRKEGVGKPGLLAFPDKDHSEPVASTQGPRPGWCYWFLWLSPNAQAALVWGGSQR